MKWLVVICVLVCVLSSADARRRRRKCPDVITHCDRGIAKNVQVGAVCQDGRFQLPVQTQIPINITFGTNQRTVRLPRLDVAGAVYVNNIRMPPFPYVTLNGKNICTLLKPYGAETRSGGSQCPLQPGKDQFYVYEDHFEVPPVNFLINHVDVIWQILDERQRKLVCVNIPVNLVQ